MNLPKANKNKKKLTQKEFVSLAKKVQESFMEELKYLQEKKLQNGDNSSSYLNSHS